MAGVYGTILLGIFASVSAVNVFNNVPVASAAYYNRTAAVNYADRYWQARNPNYVDYTSAGNNCTNYISQVLENGYLPQIAGSHNENSIWEWWHYTDWFGKHHSKTWSAADWLNQHASQYQGSRFEYKSNPTYLDRGDFFLMSLRTDGIPSHGRVIVGWGNSVQGVNYPPNTYGLLADSNTTDRYRIRWNDPVPSNAPLWSIHVVY
jgi:hypothetical protein